MVEVLRSKGIMTKVLFQNTVSGLWFCGTMDTPSPAKPEWYSGAHTTLLRSLFSLVKAAVVPQWSRCTVRDAWTAQQHEVHPDQLRIHKDVMRGIEAYVPPGKSNDASAFINTNHRPYWSTTFRAFTPLAAFVLNSLIVSFAVSSGSELRRHINDATASWYGWGTVFGVTLGMSMAFYLVFYSLYGFGGGMVAPVQPLILHPTATHELFNHPLEDAKKLAATGQYMVIQSFNACVAPGVRINMASFMHVATPPSLKRFIY